MIESVSMDRVTYGVTPNRYEAGTPPIVEAIGLAAALTSGFLGGIVPAWRAVRLPWTEAMGGRA